MLTSQWECLTANKDLSTRNYNPQINYKNFGEVKQILFVMVRCFKDYIFLRKDILWR